ncbi:MAG: PilZ domain-containing protein [Gammaproteobacteria bacterium]|nr:PilZ domain-containing protein [Gammaproteobacteria bacterium]
MQLRQFERRSTDIPIRFKLQNMVGEHEHTLKNVSRGGLCFRACGWVSPGIDIQICIPFSDKPCNLGGRVAWCRKAEMGQYETGIIFNQELSQTALRLIDQIEYFKKTQCKGQRLTSEEAARIIGAWS